MSDEDNPVGGLDDVIHQRVRLGILAALSEAKSADFSYLRNALEVTDGNLSRHLQVLEKAGLVALEKTFEGKRPKTWISATREGRTAFANEMRKLKSLVNRYG